MTRTVAADVLDASRILDTAGRLAGADLSTTPHAGALGAFVSSLREEARLTPAGERRLAAELVGDALLGWQFARRYEADPPPDSDTIAAPIVITGPPRSGTTLLQHLFACNPGVRTVRRWEMLRAAPASADDTWRRRRIAAVQEEIEAVYARMPALRAAHPMAADEPDECSLMLGHSFAAPSWFTRYRVPSYFRWQMHADLAPAYRQYRRTLSVLTRGSDRVLVLKDPSHLWHLDALGRVFPAARIVRLRRAMSDTIASYCRMCHLLRSGESDAVDAETLGPECAGMVREARCRAEDAARRMAPAHIIDVAYDELVTEPIACLRRLHERLGVPMTLGAEAAAAAWLARHPTPAARPYSLGAYGLTSADVAALDR